MAQKKNRVGGVALRPLFLSMMKKITHSFKDITPSPKTPKRVLKTTIYPHGYGSTVRSLSDVRGQPDCPLDYEDFRRVSAAVDSGEFGRALEDARLSRASITLTKESNSHKPGRARRGSKGMSFRSSQRVRANAHTLESVYGRECLGFFTATIPGHDYQAVVRIQSQWSRVLKIFKQSVSRLIGRKNAKFNYVYATEIQERRYRSSGFPYLHLHMVFVSKRKRSEGYLVTHTELRRAWVSALNTVAGDDVFWNAITDLQPVKKSVVAYLGKYLSKGAGVTADVISSGLEKYLPSEWWGSSADTKRKTEARMIRASGEISQLIYDWLQNAPDEHFVWSHRIVLDDGRGWSVELGYCYEMLPDSIEVIRAMQSEVGVS